MKNLASHIVRQRLLIEGFYTINISRGIIVNYFRRVTKALGLKTYGKPIIFSPHGRGKKANQGYDAFVPLIDSGISLYIWSNFKFFSSILYSCKHFDEPRAIDVTKNFFKAQNFESLSF